MTNKDLVRKLRKGPDLDKYLEGRKHNYVNYTEGARMYRIPYYGAAGLICVCTIKRVSDASYSRVLPGREVYENREAFGFEVRL